MDSMDKMERSGDGEQTAEEKRRKADVSGAEASADGEGRTDGARGGKVRRRWFAGLKGAISAQLSSRKADRLAPLIDVFVLLIAVLFAGRHLIFGSYPLAVALLAVLPDRVWIALAGAVGGSLFLGKSGIIYAMIAVLTVFLRIVISGGGTADGETADPRPSGLFREAPMLRVCCAVISGFVAAVYEVLLNGLTLATVAFGLSMVLLPGLLVLAFYGFFDCGIGAKDLLFGGRSLFASSGRDFRRRMALIWYRASAAVFLFFITYSLDRVSLFGIDFSYVFAAAATVFLAKRFGPLYAAAGGFLATLALSAQFSVAFALAGLAAGLLFAVGPIYALAGGCVALSAWSSYAAGLTGLLSTLPEYLIGGLAVYPLLGKIRKEAEQAPKEDVARSATDMVGTMALAYQGKQRGRMEALERSLDQLPSLLRRLGEGDDRPGEEEYRRLCADCAAAHCRACSGYEGCRSAGVTAGTKSSVRIGEKLYRGEPVSLADLDDTPPYCTEGENILAGIRHGAALLESERGRPRRTDLYADDLDLFSDLLGEVRAAEAREREMDGELSAKLERAFCGQGFPDGVVRVFGGRKKYILAAGEDESGERIGSPELKEALEQAAEVRLSPPTYFRRGNMVVLETSAGEKYAVQFGKACAPGRTEEVSGDSAACFLTEDKKFYALISDGMGSGETAKRTSSFAVEFLQTFISTGASRAVLLRILNRMLLRRGEECSTTIDLFEFDLVTGDATFVKSGAAPSYVKRRDSLFRIRSETAPLGILPKIDSERIRAEVKDGDFVILCSDGVCPTGESPRLVEFLNRPTKKTPDEYAAQILSTAASAQATPPDDKTVVVLKISLLTD